MAAGARGVVAGLLLAASLPPAASGAAAEEERRDRTAAAAHVKVELAGVDERIEVVSDGEVGHLFLLRRDDGGRERLTPEEFAARVWQEQSRQAWWNRLLNVTSPAGIAWVTLGFLGQLLFTARMLVQWLTSERERRSVVPPVFWWLSLGGATMLVIYFVWRRDIVGTCGQATGWMVYLRNLWLIYRPGGSIAAAEAAGR